MKLSGQTAINMSFAVSEMDIGYQYREFFSRKIQGLSFTSPFLCDGFGVHEKLKIRLLCEFKKDENLKSRLVFANTLAQAICYVKKFELTGMKLPSTILLGDRDECCVLHTNDIIEYLAMPFNWDIAPSNVGNELPELIKMISENEKINPFIFSVNQLDDVLEKIVDLTDNVKRLIPITTHNITEVFDYFQKHILGKTILTTNELANLFVQILVNPFENYLHPVGKVSALVTKNFNQVPVKNRKVYQSFFEHFKSEYTPREKEVLTSIVDRLVEDTTRRKQGEFFTPTIWVDKAHEYITSVFGEDWKEKYVVWDPAWGTGNLTRDYRFKELYCSTLNQSDIDTANQMGYNSEAVKFQFDFLNDPDDKLPQGLRDAIKSGREIIVFMNPPYGKPTPNNSLLEENKSKSKGMTNTLIGSEMNQEKMGIASSQLYLQFLYRIQKNALNICMFSTPGFLSQGSNTIFRNRFLSQYSLSKGFIMNSSEFADIKSWGLTFSILVKNKIDNKFSFSYDILERENNFQIFKKGEKIIYNTDNKETLSSWMESNSPKNDITFPVLKSAFGVSKKDKKGCSLSIGYINNDSNNVQQQNVIHLLTGVCKANGNKPITVENFYKIVSGFTARKIIKRNWISDKDEFIKPNTESDIFTQFKYDSVIYSLFHIHSFQTSLRQITYKEKLWDIKNEFFWMSKDEMLNLANENSYSDLYNDARTDSDRHVYKLLFGEERIYDKLSPDAKLVLDKATELVRKSMQMREVFANDENHLKSWDAGYAQLKLLWKQYYADDFKEFRELYKNLEDRMRPLVYELGFLMK